MIGIGLERLEHIRYTVDHYPEGIPLNSSDATYRIVIYHRSHIVGQGEAKDLEDAVSLALKDIEANGYDLVTTERK